jgi:hypothetical protein
LETVTSHWCKVIATHLVRHGCGGSTVTSHHLKSQTQETPVRACSGRNDKVPTRSSSSINYCALNTSLKITSDS